MIWASLATAALKRFLAQATEHVHRGVEISTQRAARALFNKLNLLMEVLLAQVPVKPILRETMNYLSKNARRAHPNRDRETGRLATGLSPRAGSQRTVTSPQSAPNNVIDIEKWLIEKQGNSQSTKSPARKVA